MEERERGDMRPEDWDNLERLTDKIADLGELASKIEMALNGSSAVNDHPGTEEQDEEVGTQIDMDAEASVREEADVGRADAVQSDLRWQTSNWTINPESVTAPSPF